MEADRLWSAARSTGAVLAEHRRLALLDRARRTDALIIEDDLPGLAVEASDGGLNVLLDLPPGTGDAATVTAARRRDLLVCDLDDMRLTPCPDRPALVLGYANLNDSLIDEAVTVLASVINQCG